MDLDSVLYLDLYSVLDLDLDSGLWILDSGPWILDPGLWTLDSGSRTRILEYALKPGSCFSKLLEATNNESMD